jgi:hypothetical protein
VVKTLGRLASGSVVLALLAAPAAAQSPPAATPAPAAATPAWKAPSKLPKLPPPPPPPDTPVRLWIIAPGPQEAWTMRIDNEGEKAIRVPADIRLLSFEVDVPSNDPKNPRKKPTTYKCALPDSMRPTNFPERRALLLGPGQSYIETFDPRLFCFGKNAAALVGTAVVRTRFGWEPPPKWSLAAKKAPVGPFAAEGTDNPPTTTPLRQLRAPTLVLSFGTPTPPPSAAPVPKDAAENAPSATPVTKGIAENAPAATPVPKGSAENAPAATPVPKGSAENAPAATPVPKDAPAPAPAPPPIVDQMAPRLAVEIPGSTDASGPRGVSVTVKVKNAGGRAMLAALRPRMLFFEVTGPDRTVICPASPPTNAIPREGYRQYKAGDAASFTLLLEETCPDSPFTRPGLYRVHAGIQANESGAELKLDAFTGAGATTTPALLRLQTSRESFYRDAPKAVPTPRAEVPADDAE